MLQSVSTTRYQEVKDQLEQHKPDLVFCTTQRATQAIAPILAAKRFRNKKQLAGFYSWDKPA